MSAAALGDDTHLWWVGDGRVSRHCPSHRIGIRNKDPCSANLRPITVDLTDNEERVTANGWVYILQTYLTTGWSQTGWSGVVQGFMALLRVEHNVKRMHYLGWNFPFNIFRSWLTISNKNHWLLNYRQGEEQFWMLDSVYPKRVENCHSCIR